MHLKALALLMWMTLTTGLGAKNWSTFQVT